MDLLLTHGYLLSEDDHEQQIMKPYPPLGLLSLHAYLRQHGFSTRVLDTTFLRWEGVVSALEASDAPTVGLYCTLMTKRTVLRLITLLKSMGRRVVLGGPEPAVYPEEFLRYGADVIVFGEGEETLAELLSVFRAEETDDLSDIEGIAYLDRDGEIRRTNPRPLLTDLDALPPPDREAIDIGAYMRTWKTHHGKSSLSVITARGCPYTCSWCSHGVYGYTHRRRSPRHVVDEIRFLRERYDPDMLWIADDVFTISHPWVREFHALMISEGLQIPFECITRADRLNEEMLDLMKDLGCFRVWLGSESGSDRILAAMSRGVDTATIKAMTSAAQARGIEVGLFVMLGYEGETRRDIDRTVRHLKETGADTFLTTVAYPLKGTPFHEELGTRVQRPGPWDLTTDRDLRITGRYPDIFYWFALRRLTNEVEFSRRTRDGAAALGDLIRLKGKSIISRVGMQVTSLARS